MHQRTPEEKKQILKNCLRIEKEGGDVLAYLASEHYVTPAATWHNMQKYDLRRAVILDGKPKTGRTEKYDKQELITKILENREKGISERATLREMGYKNPGEKYQQLKEWAMQNNTELYIRLTETREEAAKFQADTKKAETTPDVVIRETGSIAEPAVGEQETNMPEKAAEESAHADQETQKPETPEETRNGGDADHCDSVGSPGQEKEKTAEFSVEEKKPTPGLQIIGVRGQAGDWRRVGDLIHLEFPGVDVALHLRTWKKVLQDLQGVLNVLGD